MQAVDVAALIDRELLSPFQKSVVGLCFALITLDTLDLSIIGYTAPAMASDWGLNVSHFGPIFGAGLAGTMVGCLVFGAAADYVGRRFMIIGGVASFGSFTLLTANANSLPALFIFRLLTGLGLGAVIPNVIALTAEYAPARSRTMLVSMMSSGLPLGGLLAGAGAAWIIPSFGWKSVYFFGGLIPFLLVPLLIWKLPESIRFLALKKPRSPQLQKILARIAPRFAAEDRNDFMIQEKVVRGLSVKSLFIDGRFRNTIPLWIAFFSCLLLLFLLASWLPSVLRQAGIPLNKAIVGTSLFFLGGIAGGMALAWVSERTEARRVVSLGFLAAAVFTALLGMIAHRDANLVIAVVFLTGFCVIGTQVNINVLASSAYPTAIRSTGVGWALGMGRVGSIIGPVVAGMLLSSGIPIARLFLIMAVPALLGAAALWQLDNEQC